MEQQPQRGPLAGLRVVDLSRVLAGPLCAMLLGDLGADVIKVERPVHGDESRGWGPPFDGEGRSAYYLSVNRNKLSVALDFDSAADIALLRELIGEADVVVENFRPGVLERHGLDPAELLAGRSELIWCTITGFGVDNNRPGYDFTVQAESGWMAITGEQGGDPMKVGVALADVIAGKDAAISILAALPGGLRRHRERGTLKRRLTISLAGSARAALVNVAQNVLVSGKDAPRWGNAHANLVPYELFQARDRSIVIAVGSDAQWKRCANALDLPKLAADPELATNAGRLRSRTRIVADFSARLSTEDAGEWQRRLDAAEVPNGVVKSVTEALSEGGGSVLTGVPSSIEGSIRFVPPLLNEQGARIRDERWAAFSKSG